MPVVVRHDNVIDINTISQDIYNNVASFFDNYNIDIYDINQVKTIPHNLYSACMLDCYDKFFKPSHGMVNNQRSIIDYNDTALLCELANTFIDLALRFNKSIGIMQFSLMTGIHWTTLASWRDNEKANPARSEVIKSISEYHKMEQINLLNDTPVGALAVANNDIETGLEWSKNQVASITNNTVYMIPSERTDRLKLDSPTD